MGDRARRVVVIEAGIAPTGALRAAINIARAAGMQAEMCLVLPAASRVGDVDLSMFDAVVRVPMRQIRRAPVDLALYVPSLLAAAWKLRRWLREDDVLVINDFYLMHGWLLRRLGWRGRIVTWVRIDPEVFPARLRRAWLGAMNAASDMVVAVSGFIVERLRAEGVASTLLYDPVDLSRASPDPRRGGTHHLVHVANFTYGKGQDNAIAAFARIAPRFPQARLVFYGGDMGLPRNRDYRAALERQALATGLGDRILFRGFVEDVGTVLANASMALVLSHRESFSLSCLEASGCGVPVVATRCGGPQEIVEDGDTGLLCDVGDVAAIADAIERLLGDPAAAEAMGRRGAASVRERFSADVFADTLRRLLFAGEPDRSFAGGREDGGLAGRDRPRCRG